MKNARTNLATRPIAARVAPASAVPATRADGRVMPMIGDSEHEHMPGLADPVNGATDIGAAPERPGFAVTRLTDTDETKPESGLRDFDGASVGAEVAAVFNAGHGIA